MDMEFYNEEEIDSKVLLASGIEELSSIKLFDSNSDVLKSDNDLLIDNVNALLSDVKNTSYVNNGLDLEFNGSSKSKVLDTIKDVTENYFVATTNLLSNFSDYVSSILCVGENIVDLDKELDKEVENIGNGSINFREDMSDEDVTWNAADTRETIITFTGDEGEKWNVADKRDTITTYTGSTDGSVSSGESIGSVIVNSNPESSSVVSGTVYNDIIPDSTVDGFDGTYDHNPSASPIPVPTPPMNNSPIIESRDYNKVNNIAMSLGAATGFGVATGVVTNRFIDNEDDEIIEELDDLDDYDDSIDSWEGQL